MLNRFRKGQQIFSNGFIKECDASGVFGQPAKGVIPKKNYRILPFEIIVFKIEDKADSKKFKFSVKYLLMSLIFTIFKYKTHFLTISSLI